MPKKLKLKKKTVVERLREDEEAVKKLKTKLQNDRIRKDLLELERVKQMEEDFIAAAADGVDDFQNHAIPDDEDEDNVAKKRAEAKVEMRRLREEARNEKQAAQDREEKLQQLHSTAKDIIDLIRGRRVATDSVLVDAEKMKFQTVIAYDSNVSIHDRAKACEALWAFQFKSDLHKEAVILSNGVSVCNDIVQNPPRVSFADKDELKQLRKNAFVTLRSLATHPFSAATLIEYGIVAVMVSLALDVDREVPEEDRITALETLAGIAQNNKEQRRLLVEEHHAITKMFGLRNRPDLEPQRFLVRSGLEPHAHAALALLETLITRDSTRLFIVEESQALATLFNVMHSANDAAQGLVCRLVSRICENDRCRVTLRRSDFSGPVGQLFLRTASKPAKAMACAALCNLVSARDEQLARDCVPDLIATLLARRRRFRAEEEQFAQTQQQLLIPGAVRALRAFAKIPFVQDQVVAEGCLRPVVEVLLDVEAPPHARADATHVIGSVALQLRHHAAIMSAADISPLQTLLMFIKDGDPTQKAVAARCVQNLTNNPALRNKFALYRESKVKYDTDTLDPRIEKWDAIDAVTALLHRSAPLKCRSFGAGVMRNFVGIDPVRQRVLFDAEQGAGVIPRLVLLVQERPPHLATCAHAAAALGNLSRKPEHAGVICKTGDGKVVQTLVSLLNVTYPDDPEQRFFLDECRLNAAITLGHLAFSQSVALTMVDQGFLRHIQQNLSSRTAAGLRLACARALHNLSSFLGCARRIMKNGYLMDSLLRNLKAEDEEVQLNLVAVVSNLFTWPENMVLCKERKFCSCIAWLLRKGSDRAKQPAVDLVKKASKTMDLDFVEPLVKAGIITSMVPLMKKSQYGGEGGVGEIVACSVGRLAACDDDFALQCVDAKAIDGLICLLDNDAESAATQAAKTLLILAETPEYRQLMMQHDGMGVANRVLRNGGMRSCWVYAQDLLEIWTEKPPEKDTLTSFEKTIAKRRAEAKAIAQQKLEEEGIFQREDGSPMGNVSPLRNIGRNPNSPLAQVQPIRAGNAEAVKLRYLGDEDEDGDDGQQDGPPLARVQSGGLKAMARRRRSSVSRKVTFDNTDETTSSRLPSLANPRHSR